MRVFQLFLSVDPSLGRVGYSLLSDQTLMEMLIEGFDEETKQEYQDDNGMYLDVCEWSCIECDDAQRVIRIEIDSEDLSGSIEICYLPPNVKYIIISSLCKTQLRGSADLTHLPDGMQGLSLEKINSLEK